MSLSRSLSPVCSVWLAAVSLVGCTPALATSDGVSTPTSAQASENTNTDTKAVERTAAGDSSNERWPLCGVLTEQGYHPDDRLAFVVPVTPEGPAVQRYEAVDKTGQIAPLGVHAGWWLCITKGTVVRPPTEGVAGPEYGLVEIEEFSIDQSSGERGQE